MEVDNLPFCFGLSLVPYYIGIHRAFPWLPPLAHRLRFLAEHHGAVAEEVKAHYVGTMSAGLEGGSFWVPGPSKVPTEKGETHGLKYLLSM